MKNPRKKIIGITAAVLVLASVIAPAQGLYAAEFSVTEMTAVMYSNDSTKVYTQPDFNSTAVTVISRDVPVNVTGVTSNGWYRVSINGTYYIPGSGLVAKTEIDTETTTDIKTITKGTFSFYKNSELSSMEKSDIEDMDENTYIKYLDSFLMGYAMPDYCIMKDSGKYLRDVYDSKNYTSMQSYLLNYRNVYLSDSLVGPHKTEKSLKLAITRSIRYDIQKFNAVYKNTSVGTDETKMKKVVDKIVSEIKSEQGVNYSYTLEYGGYKTSDGTEGKGWIIGFTIKE